MVGGISTAASGMILESLKVDVYANNLSNVSTGGYKKNEIGVENSFDMEIKRINESKNSSIPVGSINKSEFFIDYQSNLGDGNVSETGYMSDLSIDGQGFFVIQGKNSELYTRNGNFTTNSKGELLTHDGFHVMGEKGPVMLPQNTEFTVDEEGNIESNGKIIDKLLIKNFSSAKDLVKVGNSFFIPLPNAVPQNSNVRIKQGYLEGSNVNSVEEMMKVLEAQQAYQSNQRVLKAQFETLEQAVTTVGRVS